MAQILKPSNLSLTWASGGDVLDPGNTKYATGWQVEIPPRQWFNYLDNRQDTAIAHFNQHGIPVWDAGTEYQADKSYVQGSTNGTIYRCVQTHTNQNPETDVSNAYWIIAFAAAGTFYTKAEADSTFLGAADNLSDLTNVATARTNLSVYSQAQTYTKTEVDGKTTVASTAQAQALASNTTLITPLRLSEAFKGANQSLSANGFQKLPGGRIEQWGTFTANRNSTIVDTPILFPTTFPTAVRFIVVQPWDGVDANSGANSAVILASTSGFTYRATKTGISYVNSNHTWYAIGY